MALALLSQHEADFQISLPFTVDPANSVDALNFEFDDWTNLPKGIRRISQSRKISIGVLLDSIMFKAETKIEKEAVTKVEENGVKGRQGHTPLVERQMFDSSTDATDSESSEDDSDVKETRVNRQLLMYMKQNHDVVSCDFIVLQTSRSQHEADLIFTLDPANPVDLVNVDVDGPEMGRMSSQSRKISIAVLIDSMSKAATGNEKDATMHIAEAGTSSKGNCVKGRHVDPPQRAGGNNDKGNGIGDDDDDDGDEGKDDGVEKDDGEHEEKYFRYEFDGAIYWTIDKPTAEHGGSFLNQHHWFLHCQKYQSYLYHDGHEYVSYHKYPEHLFNDENVEPEYRFYLRKEKLIEDHDDYLKDGSTNNELGFPPYWTDDDKVDETGRPYWDVKSAVPWYDQMEIRRCYLEQRRWEEKWGPFRAGLARGAEDQLIESPKKDDKMEEMAERRLREERRLMEERQGRLPQPQETLEEEEPCPWLPPHQPRVNRFHPKIPGDPTTPRRLLPGEGPRIGAAAKEGTSSSSAAPRDEEGTSSSAAAPGDEEGSKEKAPADE